MDGVSAGAKVLAVSRTVTVASNCYIRKKRCDRVTPWTLACFLTALPLPFSRTPALPHIPPHTHSHLDHDPVSEARHGPYSALAMRTLWDTHDIDSTTIVWREGMGRWITLDQCVELRHNMGLGAALLGGGKEERRMVLSAGEVNALAEINALGESFTTEDEGEDEGEGEGEGEGEAVREGGESEAGGKEEGEGVEEDEGEGTGFVSLDMNSIDVSVLDAAGTGEEPFVSSPSMSSTGTGEGGDSPRKKGGKRRMKKSTSSSSSSSSSSHFSRRPNTPGKRSGGSGKKRSQRRGITTRGPAGARKGKAAPSASAAKLRASAAAASGADIESKEVSLGLDMGRDDAGLDGGRLEGGVGGNMAVSSSMPPPARSVPVRGTQSHTQVRAHTASTSASTSSTSSTSASTSSSSPASRSAASKHHWGLLRTAVRMMPAVQTCHLIPSRSHGEAVEMPEMLSHGARSLSPPPSTSPVHGARSPRHQGEIVTSSSSSSSSSSSPKASPKASPKSGKTSKKKRSNSTLRKEKSSSSINSNPQTGTEKGERVERVGAASSALLMAGSPSLSSSSKSPNGGRRRPRPTGGGARRVGEVRTVCVCV